MKAVALREFESRLNASLRDVSRGEIVLITDRGRAARGQMTVYAETSALLRWLFDRHLASVLVLRQALPEPEVLPADVEPAVG